MYQWCSVAEEPQPLPVSPSAVPESVYLPAVSECLDGPTGGRSVRVRGSLVILGQLYDMMI